MAEPSFDNKTQNKIFLPEDCTDFVQPSESPIFFLSF